MMNLRTPIRLAALLALAVAALGASAGDGPRDPVPAAAFDGQASVALRAMKARADELHVSGVAVVACAQGDSVASWRSMMLVVGGMTQAPKADDKGANLLGIAYAKASEMASTLKDSGNGGRPPMTGEFGWHGGVVAKGRTGILIAAFSGGRDQDDLSISRAGLAALAGSL